MEKRVDTLEEFEAEARAFAGGQRPRTSGATLVTLAGELGAGKTAFTKAAAKALGVTEVVNSPTFVLEKIYALPPSSSFSKLIHIDAYRLESPQELAPLRLGELMQDPGNLIFFEWPERAAGVLPIPAIAIMIKALPDGGRSISYA